MSWSDNLFEATLTSRSLLSCAYYISNKYKPNLHASCLAWLFCMCCVCRPVAVPSTRKSKLVSPNPYKDNGDDIEWVCETP